MGRPTATVPAMPGPRIGRWRRTGSVALIAAIAATGCGQPRGLDTDEAAVQARTCAGLLVRNADRARQAGRPAQFRLDGVKVDPFADPAGFLARLEEVRGPDRFPPASTFADVVSSAGALVRQCRPDAAPTDRDQPDDTGG
ncbi:hypothetical protein BH18ACT4_BH18ACT4_09640 [soil metagenome]